MLKKVVVFVLFSTFVTGCGASPQFIRGHYYMTGDSNCRLSRPLTDTSINCYNSDDELTGSRNAMTDQQMQMHMHEEREYNESIRSRNKEFNETIRSINERNRSTTCYDNGTGVINCNSY
jgi:hypothetical protein